MTAGEIAEKYTSQVIDPGELEIDIFLAIHAAVIEARKRAPQTVFNNACLKCTEMQDAAGGSLWLALIKALIDCYPQLKNNKRHASVVARLECTK